MDLWTWIVKRCGNRGHVTSSNHFDPNHNGDRNHDGDQNPEASQNDPQANGNQPMVILFIADMIG